ncbi:sodium-dependent transporter [Salinirubrum litoreum]|uniref:Sodium-dependent transporter n=1 Tax=Salinirubrum litoreum TaxID=1126234 RepID=A0ABD5RAN4_9EURY|nr:sodium-dependent transporter [Salinirubrum litoreum]
MERWSSRLGFLLSATAAAVGLGNVWRFAAVVGTNGGGAYLVPYLLSAFLLALPLLVLEISVGRRLRADVVSAFRRVRPEFAPLGWLVVVLVALVVSYYLVVTGWTLAFLVAAVGGVDLTFTSLTATYWPVPAFLVSTLVAGVVVGLGVRGGIERMATVVMPVILVVLLGLLAYGATLPGFGAGVRFLFEPDFSVWSDPLLWSAAFGQVFFSLSVGQGIMLTYGSYLDPETNVPESALLVTVADIGVALLAGLVIFPIVFSFGLEPASGSELAFTTLPRAFAAMPGGRLVAVAFFGLLFVAAVSSAVSILEVVVAAVVGRSERSRARTTAGVLGLIALAGLPSALSYTPARAAVFGQPVLDLLDETVGTLGLPISAVVVAVVFTWFVDRETLGRELGTGWLGRFLLVSTKYATPAVLLLVTAATLLAGEDGVLAGRVPELGTFDAVGAVVGVLAVAVAVWSVLQLRGRQS